MTTGEQIDRLVVMVLKNCRICGEAPAKAWVPVHDFIHNLARVTLETEILDDIAELLLAIHKSIWNRDTHVRNADVDFANAEQCAFLGRMAVDARDFNHLRTRVVSIINLLCGEPADPNVADGRLATNKKEI